MRYKYSERRIFPLLTYYSPSFDAEVRLGIECFAPPLLDSKEVKASYDNANNPVTVSIRGTDPAKDTALLSGLCFSYYIFDPLVGNERLIDGKLEGDYASVINSRNEQVEVLATILREICNPHAEVQYKRGVNLYDVARCYELVAMSDLRTVLCKEPLDKANELSDKILTDYFSNFVKDKREISEKSLFHASLDDTFIGKHLKEAGYSDKERIFMSFEGNSFRNIDLFITGKGGDAAFIKKLYNADVAGIDIQKNTQPEYLKYFNDPRLDNGFNVKIKQSEVREKEMGLNF